MNPGPSVIKFIVLASHAQANADILMAGATLQAAKVDLTPNDKKNLKGTVERASEALFTSICDVVGDMGYKIVPK